MRTTSRILLVLAGLASSVPAFAQSPAATNPATPSSSQAMPESRNSLPPGAGVQSEPTSNGIAAANQGTSNETTTTPRHTARHRRAARRAARRHAHQTAQ